MHKPTVESTLIGVIFAMVCVAVIGYAFPTSALTLTDAEAKRQLALEAANLASFGNPFGKTGKFEELYDPTGKPWWKIQLDKEAWSMETYGNPFGYFIPQRVLTYESPSSNLGSVVSVSGSTGRMESETIPTPTEHPTEEVAGSNEESMPSFVSNPYFIPATGYVSESMIGAKAIAIQFSEPLPRISDNSQPYRLICVNPSNPDGVGILADPLSGFDDGTRRVAIVYGFGSGHYSCRFRYTQPIVVESNVIEFDVE